MPRRFAVNSEYLRMAAGAAMFLALALLLGLALPVKLQAQAPALTTINGTVYLRTEARPRVRC